MRKKKNAEANDKTPQRSKKGRGTIKLIVNKAETKKT